MKVKMLVTENWKLLHYGSAPYGELYNVQNDPEDLDNLWDDPDYSAIKSNLTDRLLSELIDDELGDPSLVLKRRSVGGTLRRQDQMESEPTAKSDLTDRLNGIRGGTTGPA